MRFLTLCASPLLFSLLAIHALGAAERPQVPQVDPLPDEQMFGMIVVKDLPAVVKKLDALVASFHPQAKAAGEVSVAMTRAFGGEAAFAEIGSGSVVIAFAQGGMAPNVVCIIPTAKPEQLAEAMNGRRLTVEALEKAVLISPQQGAGDLGARIAPLYASLSIDGDADVRLVMAPQRILAAYAPMITPMIGLMKANMAKQPQTAEILPILLAEIAGFRILGEQVETLQVDVSITADAITSRQVLVAVDGSSLANVLIEPPVAVDEGLAKRMGNEPGWMVMMGRFDMAASCQAMVETLGALQADPDLTEMISDDLIDSIRAAGEIAVGTIAQRMRSTAESPMVMDAAFGITDGEAYRTVVRAMMTTMFSGGLLGEMYAKMGLSMSIEDDVRTIGDLPVTRVAYQIDETKADPATLEQLRRSMHDMELATPSGYAVLAHLPADLDRLVAGTDIALTTTAARTIGAGRDILADVAVIPMARAMLRMQPSERTARMLPALEELPSGEPITFGWTADSGRGLIEWRVPLKPLVDLTQTLRKIFEGAAPAANAGGAERVF